MAAMLAASSEILLEARSPPFAGSGASTYSYSFTVGTGGNRILLVKLSSRNSAVTTHTNAVRWGGPAGTLLTKIAQASTADAVPAVVSIWYLLAPASGTADVYLSLGASGACGSEAASFANAAQEAPVFGSGDAVNLSFVQTGILVPTAFSSWCDACCITNDPTVTAGLPDQPLVQHANAPTGSHRFYTGSAAPISGQVRPRWEFGGGAVTLAQLAVAAVLMKPAGGGAITRNASGAVAIPAVTAAGAAAIQPATPPTITSSQQFVAASTDPHDLTFTVPSGADKLVVGISIDPTSASTLASVTWYPNGTGTPGTAQTLTARVTADPQGSSAGPEAHIWDRDNPTPAVGGTIRIDLTGSLSLGAFVWVLENAAPSGVGNPITNTASGVSANPAGTAIDPLPGSLIIDQMTLNTSGIRGTTETVGQTEVSDVDIGTVGGMMASRLTSTTGDATTMNWSFTLSVTYTHAVASYVGL